MQAEPVGLQRPGTPSPKPSDLRRCPVAAASGAPTPVAVAEAPEEPGTAARALQPSRPRTAGRVPTVAGVRARRQTARTRTASQEEIVVNMSEEQQSQQQRRYGEFLQLKTN